MKESYSKKRVKLLKQNKDYDALYRYCSRFALDKNWDAFLEVSKCYMHGWGVEKNPLHAYMIHMQLASMEQPKGYYYLAWDYYEGLGVKTNQRKAFRNFLMAANKGVVDAMFNVAILYYNGIGVQIDEKQAAYWFSQAAVLGHGQAQFNLAICYEEGRGLDRNAIQANYWMEQASANGIASAQNYLGQEEAYVQQELDEIVRALQTLDSRVEKNMDLDVLLKRIKTEVKRIEEKTMKIKKGQLIVSCQSLPDEPLHSSYIMGRMAVAAKEGGAAGIRANTVEDIAEIQKNVDLPVIGIIKRVYGDNPVFITPTMKEIDELMTVKPAVIALDATLRPRPDGVSLDDLVQQIRQKYPEQTLMADCSTLEEMKHADEIGFDFIGTTLIGYTEESKDLQVQANDFEIIRDFIAQSDRPVIAEGNIDTPEKARRVLDLGCYAVVVGSIITRPQLITKRFVDGINR